MTALAAATIVAFVLLVLLVGSVVVTLLDRRRRAQHAASLEISEEAEGLCAMVEDLKAATRRVEFFSGDTLTLVGAELVHRRCADARRDGRQPGPCCAARLARGPQ